MVLQTKLKQNKINTRLLYISIWLFYGLNCLLYNYDLAFYMIIGFFTGFFLLAFMFYELRQSLSLFDAMIALMIIVLPVSFRSILCTGYDQLPMPWFYLLIFFQFALLLFFNIRLQISFLLLVFLLLIPMVLSNDIFNGFKQYLSYLSFCLGGLIAYGRKSTISKTDFSLMLDLYINGVVFVAIGVIGQYVALNQYGVELFRIETYGFERKLLMFLFYDMSGNTVYMATAVLLLLFSNKMTKWIFSILIITAMAMTSARAGTIALIIVLVLILLFEKTKSIKKLPLIIFSGIAGLGAFYILLSTRKAFSTISEMVFQDTGRNYLVQISLERFLNSPIFGCGLDFGNQMRAQGYMIPHNAMVNFLAQSGILITMLIVVMLISCVLYSRTYKDKALFWCCVLCIIGSCVSPSFFNLRFFTVIFMLCYIGPHNENFFISK